MNKLQDQARNRYKRMILIVLDSVGIGAAPDAAEFGDEGAHTLGHISERAGLHVPHMAELGLGLIEPLKSVPAVEKPRGFYGKMQEISRGKDTTTGHWEIVGLETKTPFRTYPDGFPEQLIREFSRRTNRPVIGNKPASGTEIIAELGEEQMKTGAWIVYTSADSVFQIAAHEEVIPLEELYRACEIARELTLQEPYAVVRVIARPYIGIPGHFERTPNRRDFSLSPPGKTVLDALVEGGYETIGIGKIEDIFAGVGVKRATHTTSNEHGVDVTLEYMDEDFTGLLFTNLVDFDSKYGHRRDPEGYRQALEAFDRRLPEILERLRVDDLLIITADHGNDPYHHGTDHTREYVPLLVVDPVLYFRGDTGTSLGVRKTFADIAQTIADNFEVARPAIGTSFLREIHARR
ncbi:MAG: Phosphopentomutase [Candidatus Carbobacillus altaicus]|uniref:Phosphopentomutase n=1 Tax=Candidatus Carbonibacillus altaicus TaxID=2163959 RepID=A0A2R6Y368_9BACL|nr:MAG: Phosphopentomutase [Candidatus Carbobacillus altaicus]